MFVANVDGDLFEAGFWVGRKVALTKRISTNFGKKYCDVNKSETGFVKGTADGSLVVTFTKNFGGKVGEVSADVKIKPKNLTVDIGESEEKKVSSLTLAATPATTTPPGAKKHPKHLEFLSTLPGDVQTSAGWWNQQARASDESKLKMLHSSLGFSLQTLFDWAPTFGQKDLCVAMRDGKAEVWALREFKAHELVLVPETNEWKDRHYTSGTAALTRFDDRLCILYMA